MRDLVDCFFIVEGTGRFECPSPLPYGTGGGSIDRREDSMAAATVDGRSDDEVWYQRNASSANA